jgi:hypothetical protein
MISGGSIAIIIAVILIYGIIIISEIKKARDKGSLLVSSQKVINSSQMFLCLYIILLTLKLGSELKHDLAYWDELDMLFTVYLALTSIFFGYKSLKKHALYEKVLVTAERTYLLNSIIAYEWGNFIKEEDGIVLRLKVRESLFSDTRIKEVYFKVKPQEKEKIEVFLSTNIIKNEL